MSHIGVLISIIAGCGLLGGIINYFRSTDSFHNSNFILYKSLITGLGAAALVPLFLKMISSDLLVTSKTNEIEYFVIGGFCLISSIFSAKFIETIGEKLQIQVDQVAKEVKEVKNDLEEVTTENDYERAILGSDEYEKLNVEEKLILQKMYLSKFTYRSLSGIANEIYSTKDETLKLLNNLVIKGHIEKALRKNSTFRWKLSDNGRILVAENYDDESSG
jgi:hypothetical protein